MAESTRTFYRTDAITGEVSERVVITPADEVRAKFDGFRAEKKAPAAKKSNSGSSSSAAAAE